MQRNIEPILLKKKNYLLLIVLSYDRECIKHNSLSGGAVTQSVRITCGRLGV